MTDPVPSKDQLAGLITQILGERCADYDANCMTCQAWRMLDALRGIQSCSTCEACRGAATRALDGAPPQPTSEICKQLRALPGGYRLLGYTAAEAIERLSRPAHEREAPHCSTCACGMAVHAPLTDAEIDAIANEGHRNAAGGIYATSVYEFARAIESAHRAPSPPGDGQ